MHLNLFDHYQDAGSRIHGIDPRIKVLLTLAFILTTILLPDGAWAAFLLAWLVLLMTIRLGGISPVYVFKRSLVAIPFALAAITLLFTLPGRPLLAFSLGSWDLIISQAGLTRFLSILLRSWLSVQAAILLTATTRFPDLLHALRHLHVPKILVATIAFMYRYLFVIADEAMRLLRAREARSAASVEGSQKRPLAWRARVAGNMVGQLFLRSLERSERVHNAMVARGFQGDFLTINPHHLHRQDWQFGAAGLSVMLIILWIGTLY